MKFYDRLLFSCLLLGEQSSKTTMFFFSPHLQVITHSSLTLKPNVRPGVGREVRYCGSVASVDSSLSSKIASMGRPK